MAGIQRLTWQVAKVLDALLTARVNSDPDEQKLHGYALIERTGLSGPSVYRILDRLEDMDLVTAWWEPLTEDRDGPRKRCYVLNDKGIGAAYDAIRRYPPEVQRERQRTRLRRKASPELGTTLMVGLAAIAERLR